MRLGAAPRFYAGRNMAEEVTWPELTRKISFRESRVQVAESHLRGKILE